MFPTTHHGHAELLAEEAIQNRFDVVVAVGGDGTVNQIVNGMISSRLPVDELPLLVVWPAGSGNDFARTISCPTDPHQIERAIGLASTVQVDVGRLSYSDDRTHHFVNIAEIGIGTTVIQRAEKMQRWVGNRLGYQLAIMRTAAASPEFEAKVEGDDFSFRGRFSTIAVANAKYYGSGLGIAPDASVSDGLLDVVLMRGFSIVDFLKYRGRLKRCEKISDSRLQIYQTRSLTVEGKVSTSFDGELGHRLPVSVDVLPGRIRVAKLPQELA